MNAAPRGTRRGGRGSRRGAGLLVGLVAAAGALTFIPNSGIPTSFSPPSAQAVIDPGAGLTVAPDGPPTGYDREARFGGWAYTGDGCNTRDRVLARDLTAQTVVRGCDVATGSLVEPYTGQVVTGSTRALDIDHVVPLALAWRSGASHWTDERRRAFANDPGELLTTTAHENRARGDDGPETWLPQRDRCGFAARFADVVRRYGLTVTAPRLAALRGACAPR